MMYDAKDSLYANGDEKRSVSQHTTFEQSSPASMKAESAPSAMSVKKLAVHCVREINNSRCGDPSIGERCIELLCRAIMQGDLEAWEIVQQCLSETVRGWMKLHPSRPVVACLDSEESYAAQAFARFYRAVVSKRVHFSSLSVVLQYLQASLNSVILDTLRAYSRPREILLTQTGDLKEAAATYSGSSEVWENLRKVLSDTREQRMAYLLFHCGLSPEEIVQSCTEEFNDVPEITRLRYRIIERLLCSEITFIAAE